MNELYAAHQSTLVMLARFCFVINFFLFAISSACVSPTLMNVYAKFVISECMFDSMAHGCIVYESMRPNERIDDECAYKFSLR